MHSGSVKLIFDGERVSSEKLQMPAPTEVPWKRKPESSGKKPGSYDASTGISRFDCRSMILTPPAATKRPDAELRDQKVVWKPRSRRTRSVPPLTAQPCAKSLSVDDGKVARHDSGLVAPLQPNIDIPLSRLTAPQPSVFMRDRCASSSALQLSTQLAGGAASGKTSSSAGRFCANQPETAANSSALSFS